MAKKQVLVRWCISAAPLLAIGCSGGAPAPDHISETQVSASDNVPTCDAQHHGRLQVSALIDGRSLLHVTPTGILWEHLDFAGPGMLDGQTVPTNISATIAGVSSSIAWCPIWANGCNTCDGSCGELRQPMRSLPLDFHAFPGSLTSFALTACDGRSSCRLAQAPTASNGFEAIIDFNDDPPGGDANYSATLDYCMGS